MYMAYRFTVDTRDIEIAAINEHYQYTIIWESLPVGYIYVSELDEDLNLPIWKGSTPYLDTHANAIGRWIESCDR